MLRNDALIRSFQVTQEAHSLGAELREIQEDRFALSGPTRGRDSRWAAVRVCLVEQTGQRPHRGNIDCCYSIIICVICYRSPSIPFELGFGSEDTKARPASVKTALWSAPPR